MGKGKSIFNQEFFKFLDLVLEPLSFPFFGGMFSDHHLDLEGLNPGRELKNLFYPNIDSRVVYSYI